MSQSIRERVDLQGIAEGLTSTLEGLIGARVGVTMLIFTDADGVTMTSNVDVGANKRAFRDALEALKTYPYDDIPPDQVIN
jgi:hypothetical protein